MLNFLLNVALDGDLWGLVKIVEVVLVVLKLTGQLAWTWLAVLSPILIMISLYTLYLVIMVPQFARSNGGRRPSDAKPRSLSKW